MTTPHAVLRARAGVALLAASLIASLTTTLAAPLAAQPRTADPAVRGVPLTAFPRLVPLADNVYGYEEIRQPGFTTVSLIVVGTQGVLVADGQGSVPATQAMLDKIRTITSLPIKWYVVGSDHGDHTAGNSVLPPGDPVHRASLLGDEAAGGRREGHAHDRRQRAH